MIKGLKDGTVDALVSNHQPQDEDSKKLEFDLAEFGITSMQTVFPCLVEISKEVPLEHLLEKITVSPRRILNLSVPQIDVGEKANLTLFDPKYKWVLDESTNLSKSENSPFFGKDGKFVTSRHIKERLEKELDRNLALRVELTESADKFLVFGRGVMHLSVLIETMRREGYELQIGQPQVIIKNIDGIKCEPIETLTIDLPENLSGKAIELVTLRKGEIVSLENKGDRI